MTVVREFARWITSLSINVYVAEWSVQPGQPLPEKVARNIDASDCILVILTQGGMRSEWVNQEVGYAKKAGKAIVPIVEEGVEVKGFLQGLEHVPFHRNNVNKAVVKAANYLQSLSAQKVERERQNAIFGGLLFLGLLALLASGD